MPAHRYPSLIPPLALACCGLFWMVTAAFSAGFPKNFTLETHDQSLRFALKSPRGGFAAKITAITSAP